MRNKLIQNVEIDIEHGCVYLRLGVSTITQTKEYSDNVHIDIDKDGKIVGLEFVGLNKNAIVRCIQQLARVYKGEHLNQVRSELRLVDQYV